MEKRMFTRKELLEESGVGEEDLTRLEKAKLLAPVGATSDGLPLYPADTLDRLKKLATLIGLGYQREEVLKIIKKVGFPGAEGKRRGSPGEGRFLTVGGLAEKVGISPRAIKHWEDKGIIAPDMRSEGGFRLYSEGFVFLCELIRDLQLFGYTLEEIKEISDLFRDFLAIQGGAEVFSPEEAVHRLDEMKERIGILVDKMELLRAGIDRWDDLLKKKKKEITALKSRFLKRLPPSKRSSHG